MSFHFVLQCLGKESGPSKKFFKILHHTMQIYDRNTTLLRQKCYMEYILKYISIAYIARPHGTLLSVPKINSVSQNRVS